MALVDQDGNSGTNTESREIIGDRRFSDFRRINLRAKTKN